MLKSRESAVEQKSELVLAVRGSKQQIQRAIQRHSTDADLIEWRLDLLEGVDKPTLAQLKQAAQLPSIFTLGPLDTHTKKEQLFEVLALRPTYLDLAWNTPLSLVRQICRAYPSLQIIASYHHFEKTPPDLEAIFCAMRRFPAAIFKLATTARSTLDALRMLRFVAQKRAQGISIAGMCMGKLGSITRILAPVVGSRFIYAAATEGKKTAAGQLTLTELVDTYRVKELTSDAVIYGLIGQPVDKSVGHLCHNALLRQLGAAAVYVKIELPLAELAQGFQLMQALPICGLSVTMPLKKAVGALLNRLDPKAKAIGAVNTLAYQNGQWIGYNTDAKAALDAIEDVQQVAGKAVWILGAGGAARAIAFEAASRGANVMIFNRTQEKAVALAQEVGGAGYPIASFAEHAQRGYAVLVNATSVGMAPQTEAIPVHFETLLKRALVFDAVAYPKQTRLLAAAKEKECCCIGGLEMYIRQAAEQMIIWLGKPAQRTALIAALRKTVNSF
ncbi:MAG: shikimate dehydrogenase [Chlamydiota bacterium]